MKSSTHYSARRDHNEDDDSHELENGLARCWHKLLNESWWGEVKGNFFGFLSFHGPLKVQLCFIMPVYRSPVNSSSFFITVVASSFLPDFNIARTMRGRMGGKSIQLCFQRVLMKRISHWKFIKNVELHVANKAVSPTEAFFNQRFLSLIYLIHSS